VCNVRKLKKIYLVLVLYPETFRIKVTLVLFS
jgi:hypothetical protein